MMKARILTLAAAIVIGSASPFSSMPTAHAQDQEGSDTALTPREILDRSLDQNGLGITAGIATVRLTVEDGGKSETKELRIESKREGSGSGSRSRITLLAPAEMAGEAYLFLGNESREDDVYMYLPAFKQTRKVSGTDKNGAFLGTHLTYRDLETRDLESGEAKRLDDEKIGPHECFVIEATPPSGEDSEYSRVVAWVRKDDYMPLRVEFYGRDGVLDKRMFSEKISRQGETRYVKKLSIQPEKGGKTTMEVLEVDFAADLPDRTFSKDALGQ